jgi:small subunit ribosomal protein S12e
MSDVGSEDVPVVVEEEEITDLFTAVRKVLKNAMYTDGVVRGLHQVTKAIDGGHAQVVFLSESCNEAVYKKLIQALCAEKQVPLVNVPDSKQLGEWAGLCKIDSEGNPVKVVGASTVAVTDYGEESEALNFLSTHIQSQ